MKSWYAIYSSPGERFRSRAVLSIPHRDYLLEASDLGLTRFWVSPFFTSSLSAVLSLARNHFLLLHAAHWPTNYTLPGDAEKNSDAQDQRQY